MDAAADIRCATPSGIPGGSRLWERDVLQEAPRARDDASDDSELVRAACGGDRSALARLHARYAGMVHSVLLARVSREDAEDLVQDVFIIAMERLPTLRDTAVFGAWLMAIARNCASDLHRRHRVIRAVPESLHRPSEPSVEAREMLDVVRSLPVAYRETLLMRFVEGLTGPEIARRTGLTEGSVRVNLCRGMQLLREKLGAGESS